MEPTRAGVREAHQQYLATGRIAPDLLRPSIRKAWERSHDLGADPRILHAEMLSDLDTARLLDRKRDFAAAARPYLEALARAAGGEHHAAMLGDAAGTVLDVVGDETSVHGAASVPGPGALLSEAAAGANGIGTPLVENGYVEIVGPEHFVSGFDPFTCQGLPVRDVDGSIAGVVSVSMRGPDAAERLREILVCTAHGVEAELWRARLEEDVRRLAGSADADAGLVERLRQDIVQSQAAARITVEAAATSLARSRFERAARMIQLAERSIEGFRRRSALWHDLAAGDAGRADDVALDAMLADLLLLLRTEAVIRHVAVEPASLEPAVVRADPHRLARRLFRAILRAFAVAEDGGAVRVTLSRRGAEAEILIHPDPPPASGRAPEIARLVFPLASASMLPPEPGASS